MYVEVTTLDFNEFCWRMCVCVCLYTEMRFSTGIRPSAIGHMFAEFDKTSSKSSSGFTSKDPAFCGRLTGRRNCMEMEPISGLGMSRIILSYWEMIQSCVKGYFFLIFVLLMYHFIRDIRSNPLEYFAHTDSINRAFTSCFGRKLVIKWIWCSSYTACINSGWLTNLSMFPKQHRCMNGFWYISSNFNVDFALMYLLIW